MRDKLRIVGIGGPKYSGKDTAAKGLTQITSNFRRAPMAEGVKNICKEVFGYTDALMEDPELKESPTDFYPYVAPRWPMMDIANWMRDKYGGDVWPQRWERISHNVNTPKLAHVITDVRFPEEIAMIERHEGLIIYIQRDEAEQSLKAKQEAGDSMALNPSEMHYAYLRAHSTHIVDNNDSVPRLHAQIQAIVRERYGYWGHWGNDAISRR